LSEWFSAIKTKLKKEYEEWISNRSDETELFTPSVEDELTTTTSVALMDLTLCKEVTSFDAWFDTLNTYAESKEKCIKSKDEWEESYSAGFTVEEAFQYEFGDDKDNSIKLDSEGAETVKQSLENPPEMNDKLLQASEQCQLKEEESTSKKMPEQMIVTDNSVMIKEFDSDEVIVVDTSHKNFINIRALMEYRKPEQVDWVRVYDLINIKSRIENYTSASGKISVKDGRLVYKNRHLTGKCADHIIKLMEEGDEDFERYVNFYELLMKNPCNWAVDRLFLFLIENDIYIREDGLFVAYRSVAKGFKDKHTGKFDNSPGVYQKVDRNEVDPDWNKDCSHGLHIAAKPYLDNTWGYDALIECYVNPANVVAIPTYKQFSKIRVCAYYVSAHLDVEDFRPRKYGEDLLNTKVIVDKRSEMPQEIYDLVIEA